MKEMFKSKVMILFVFLMLSITYVGALKTNKLDEPINSEQVKISYNYN